MSLSFLDWGIVAAMLSLLFAAAIYSNRFTKNVSDFLAAGRSGGRYMVTMASGMVWIGAINVVAMFELYYNAGFNAMWWVMLTTPATLYISISGWAVYRFRETRALTVAQFLETRYNRPVRVMAGILAWLAGIVNFGLFPAVGARFFMAFCNLPISFDILGISVPTFPVVMIALLGTSLFFVFKGGQIAVMLTDCLQGMFTQIAAVLIVGVLFFSVFNWNKILYVLHALGDPAQGKSLLNPLKAWNQAGGFTLWFFITTVICFFFTILSNLQSQSYIASAKTAHEFRMGATLNQWRWQALLVFFMVLVLCSMVILHHPDYTDKAATINARLNELVAGQPNEVTKKALRGQLIITSAIPYILPIGFAGIFCSIMLAALISTYDSFMHTWGAVFLQDIVMPFKKKPFKKKETHMTLLRLSILGVAVFAFLFSMFFPNPENILMYFAMVNNLWLGGSGAVIIGGLYWKRGTTTAAITSMILGLIMGLIGIFFSLVWPEWKGEPCPINPQWWFFITVMACIVIYVAVSLLQNLEFNMDKMLHRGKYRAGDEPEAAAGKVAWYHKMLGITPEFTKGDRLIAYLIVGWFLGWLLFFCVGMLYAKIANPGEDVWSKFWIVYLVILFIMAVGTTIWFTIGSVRDIFNMFRMLKEQKRDDSDDGFVRHKDDDSAETAENNA